MTSSPATVVCVLGMHRSGTSFITRALGALGVYLGPEHHAIGGREDNPLGFSEHHVITHLNDEMLIFLGGSWDNPPILPAGWENDPRLDDFRACARAMLESDFGSSPLWGWKDPRTCLTLPFWRQLLPSMRYVICVRSPLAVARSLQVRDGFTIEKGGSLWVDHTAAALQHSSGGPRLLVGYDDVVERPEMELRRLAAFVGASASADDVAAVRAFADEGLRHHRAETDTVLADDELPFASKALFLAIRLLLDLQRHDPSGTGGRMHDLAVERLAEEARRMQSRELERRRIEAQLRQQGAELDAMSGQLGDLTLSLQQSQAEEAHLQHLIDEMRLRLAYRETVGGAVKGALRSLLPDRLFAGLRGAYSRFRG